MATNGEARENPVTGEVTFEDENGKEITLRPSFEAMMEIEEKLGMAVDALLLKFSVAGANVDLSPTTKEYGVVVYVGSKAAGNTMGMTQDVVNRKVYAMGRHRLRSAMVKYLWALTDGGRSRVADLEKRGSSPALNGADKGSEVATAVGQMIDEMGRDNLSGGSSG